MAAVQPVKDAEAGNAQNAGAERMAKAVADLVFIAMSFLERKPGTEPIRMMLVQNLGPTSTTYTYKNVNGGCNPSRDV